MELKDFEQALNKRKHFYLFNKKFVHYCVRETYQESNEYIMDYEMGTFEEPEDYPVDEYDYYESQQRYWENLGACDCDDYMVSSKGHKDKYRDYVWRIFANLNESEEMIRAIDKRDETSFSKEDIVCLDNFYYYLFHYAYTAFKFLSCPVDSDYKKETDYEKVTKNINICVKKINEVVEKMQISTNRLEYLQE